AADDGSDDDGDDDGDDLADDEAEGASAAPRRARRRPRVEHVSTPPMPVERGPKKRPSAKKSDRRKGRTSDGRASLPFEVTGIALFAVDVLLALALLSYSSKDRTPGRAVDNWIGPGGAYVADVLTLAFGMAAFVVPVVVLLVAVACFRPVQAKARAALRSTAALLATLSAMTLLHLLLRGTDLLSFPAGGLVGGLIADAGARALAPLGTGVVAAALCFIGAVVALDRPVGATARGLIDGVVDAWHAVTEQIAVWREERRILAEEAARLAEELAVTEPPAPSPVQIERERRQRRDEMALDREQRIAERARARVEERRVEERAVVASLSPAGASPSDTVVLEEAPVRAVVDVVAPVAPGAPGARLAVAPPPPAPTPAAAATPAVVDAAPTTVESDPPWTKEIDDGVVLSLAEAMKKARKPRVSPADERLARDPGEEPVRAPAAGALPSMLIDDEDLKIVERTVADAATIVAEAEACDAALKIEEAKKREFVLPPLNLLDYDAPQLDPIDEEKLRTQADKLVAKFLTFGIEGRVREVRPGPVVTTYEFVPAPGIKVSKIAALADDIAMAMEAIHVRIVAPIPGKGAVGIEIPNEKRETVYMKEIIADPAFKKRDDKLLMALGKDIDGKSYYANLADMPHVLVAGTTGSGKSVSVNAMICSILYRATPEDVRFMMIDPKMLELSLYDGIPHLLLPPIIDSKKAAVALKWAVAEMERRYQLMSDVGVRDLKGFNDKVLAGQQSAADGSVQTKLRDKDGRELQKLPYIVIIIDEYADLLAVAGKDVEGYVMRIAQKARAAGLHVMLATQRPSVDVITGVIKANFPVRMGFRLASSHDSKTIINQPGAEKLLGRGDMLFMPPGTSNVTRVHGAFLSEKEMHKVVDFLKSQGKPDYDMSILTYQDEVDGEGDGGDVDLANEPKDARYDEALALVARTKKCSTSYVQRMLNIGYQRAARIVDRMEKEGLVGPQLNTKGDRDIYMRPDGNMDASQRINV
ncbi:MAG: DNA translocase FtsK, partial [Deltaproteobacteria bacterium]|nr:DNA translocase FtsK [Deltaproteobacteria bacterium]